MPSIVQTTILRGIQQALSDLTSFPISLIEPFSVKIKPNFRTACWRCVPPHQIYVGDAIFKNARKDLTSDEKIAYVGAYVKHEASHMLWTDKDLEGVLKRLQDKKIPFRLLNLFEDARIEQLWRTTTLNTFGWSAFEELPISSLVVNGVVSPLRVFLWHIFSEELALSAGRQLPLELAILASTTLEENEVLIRRISQYYKRAIACESTLDLIPLLEEWLQEFPANAEPLTEIPALGGGATDSAGDVLPESLVPLDFDSQVINGGGSVEEEEDYLLEILQERGKLKLSKTPVERLDRARIFRLVQRLSLLFRKKEQTAYSATPSKRISLKNYLIGRDYFKVKKDTTRVLKDLVVLFDLSASMRGTPLREGIHLLAVLGELASLKYISGVVIFSLIHNQKLEYLTCSLPLPESMLVRLMAYGQAEGLEMAIADNVALVKKCSTLYCYTDADITDTPINKRELHRQGIFSVGLYVGRRHVKSAANMLNYFDRALACDTLEALVEKMLMAKLIS